ncbi:unnamed protein product [Durusdinium trenchii]|uniref:gamma-glutamylcyclotransferase n=1 Tax=Durusdinium trenchii TaxID=1381693 RepID=A0ABP0NIA2_9DINO
MTPYFGFGALMNQISLRMRGVYPRSSAAAKLVGFRLVFSGSHGMATVLRSSAADAVYGVLHMVSAEEKQRLESSESSYEAVEAEVQMTRNGQRVKCTLNVMLPDVTDSFLDSLPSERYLAVMIEGAIQHGLPKYWIEMLQTHPCAARSSYQRFPSPDKQTAQWLTQEQLAGLEGLTFAINGKIFRVAPDAPSHVKRQVMIYGAGKDHTWAVAQEYYEPLHGEPRSLEALTEAHRAFCEHQLVMQYCGPTAGCACGICPIGWLK